MYHILFMHSSVDGHLGCSHVLTAVDRAAVKLRCMCLSELGFSAGVCPGVNLLSEEQARNTGWWLISNPFSGNECVSSFDPNILNIPLVRDFLRLEMTNIKDSKGIKSSSSIDSKFIESTFLPA